MSHIKLDPRSADYDDVAPIARAPVQNLDYRNFFDFGYFSDLAASIANSPNPAAQSGNSITTRKQKGSNTVELEKFVIPDARQVDASRRVDDFF